MFYHTQKLNQPQILFYENQLIINSRWKIISAYNQAFCNNFLANCKAACKPAVFLPPA